MIKPILATALLSGVCLSPLHADIYTLKDGRTYEGKVSFQTDDILYLLVEVQPGVRDEVAIKKADLDSISKVQKDTSGKDFELIKTLIPTPDLLGEEDYQRALTNQIEPFLKKHTRSPHRREVRSIEKTLRAELAQIEAGAIKVNGKFLTEEEQEKNAYEIDANLILQELKSERDYAAALEPFSNLEKNYKNTSAFKSAIQHCVNLLQRYETSAKKIVSSADELIEKRDKSLEAMTSSSRIRAKQALATEERIYQAKLKKAQKAKAPLMPLNRFHPKIASDSLKKVAREKSKLERASKVELVDAGSLYREAKTSLAQNDLSLVKDQLQSLKRAKVPAKYIDPMQEQYDIELAAQKESDAEKKRQLAEAKRLLKEQEAEERAKKRKAAQIAAKKKRDAEKAAAEANMTAEERLKRATGLGNKQRQLEEAMKALKPTN